MRRSIALVGLILAVATLSGCATMKCGTPLSPTPATMGVETAMAKQADLMNKPVRLKGFVTAVCTGMPYIELGDEADEKGDDAILVAFDCGKCACKMPAEAKGKKAIVEGKLVAFDMSVEDQKHVAQQFGKSKDDIAKINAPKKAVKVEAVYAEIEGLDCKACCKDGNKSCAGTKCKDGAKCCGDPKKCDNPKCKETGKCQAAAAGKTCDKEACKKAGTCAEGKK